MKLEPMNDNIIIRKINREHTTESGLILVDRDAKERPDLGEVIACGPGRMEVIDNSVVRLPLTVQVGDQVLVAKFSSHSVKLGADEYFVLREHEVFAILRESEPAAGH